MQCEVCHRSASSVLPFNCTICARDTLYKPRLKHAQVLLEKESLENQIEQSTSLDSKPSQTFPSSSLKTQETSSTWTIQRAYADQSTSEDQTRTIHSHIQILREETQNMKADITARKDRLLRRRSELASAKKEQSHSQATAQEPLKKSIRRTAQRWDILHTKSTESRLFLCKEAAHLYGLKHQERRKGVRGRDVYTIGGVPIIDLRDLNNASPTEVTVSTSHLAHLVHLSSHYLALKLPAEITLPHRDYPCPTIFSPSSSYTTTRPVPFPGTTPSHSPEASRHKDNISSNTSSNNDSRPLPRPRILQLSKPLPTLAKDDQLAYANFVEAITFLAWDIAWLCRTQGLSIGQSSWEDVCAMGRNLYQLLLAPSPPPSPLPLPIRARSPLPSPPAISPPNRKSPLSQQPGTIPKSLARRRTSTAAAAATATPDKGPPTAAFPPAGHFSHGSSYAFLSTAAGSEYMRSWRLALAVKVVERVKVMLAAERTGAEWEILEGEEWAAAAAVEESDEGSGVVEGEEEEEEEEEGEGLLLGLGRTGVLVGPAAGGGSGGGKITSAAAAAVSTLAAGGRLTGRKVGEKDGSGLGTGIDFGREKEKANGWMKVKSRNSGSGAGTGTGAAAATGTATAELSGFKGGTDRE